MKLSNFKIISENRKTMSIFVYPNKSVLVKVPLNANKDDINDFLRRKSSWIQTQMDFFDREKIVTIDSLSNGSEIFFLGKQYQLVIKKSAENSFSVKKEKNIILLSVPSNTSNEKSIEYLKNWLREKVVHEFYLALKRNVQKFSQLKNIPGIKIRKLSRRWGSLCKGNIILNPNLIFSSRACIDYIVIHELCHLFVKKHNSQFYSLLGSKIPNWRDVKKKLEENKYTF